MKFKFGVFSMPRGVLFEIGVIASTQEMISDSLESEIVKAAEDFVDLLRAARGEGLMLQIAIGNQASKAISDRMSQLSINKEDTAEEL